MSYDVCMKLEVPKPPPCPICTGPTVERTVADPHPGDLPFWNCVKIWFDCAYCAKTWESCGVCHRGALVEGEFWGEPGVKKLTCKGGCGWGVSWRPGAPA
jgi:hypothetical protein